MTALRQFLSRREAEILEQMKLLERELAEIRAAWSAVQGSDETRPSSKAGATITIKEMIRRILRGRPDGMSANEILQEIERRFGVRIERTSLSPQLSRLRDGNELTLENGRWYPAQMPFSKLAELEEILSDARREIE